MVAFGSAVVLTLVVFSRVMEYPVFRSMYLAVISFSAAVLLAPLGSGLGALIRDRLMHWMLLLTVLMLLAIPFGIWRGGSVAVVQVYWVRSLIVFVSVAAAVSTFAQFRKLLITFTVAIVCLSVYSLTQGSSFQGRIGMESGFFSNPNDLAAILMMAVPICAGVGRLLQSVMLKTVLLGSTAFLWATFFRTGSRGGFIAMVVVCALLFLHTSIAGKMRMLIVGILLVAVAVVYLPSSTLKRFLVLSDSIRLVDFEQGEEDAYTATSSESRLEMAKQGVIFTLQNPILGLGAGNFRIASTDLFKSKGMYSPWTDVHNTYLQVSSENGIPALLCYFALLVGALRRMSRFYRLYRGATYPENQWIADAAWYLRLAIISYMVSAAFGNYAYQYHMPVLMGLTIALTTAEANRPAAVRVPELIQRRPGVNQLISKLSGSRPGKVKPLMQPSLPLSR
jgi:O-antigen ligase